MRVFVNNEDYYFEIKTYLNAYFHDEQIEFVQSREVDKELEVIIDQDYLKVLFYKDEQIFEEALDHYDLIPNFLLLDEDEKRKELKRVLKILVYDVLKKAIGLVQPWGVLTGIRPTKVIFKLFDRFQGDEALIVSSLWKDYRVSEEKIKLMLQVAKKEQPIIKRNRANEISIYIGIPYCPSKCLYCSFTSYPIGQKEQTSRYLDALSKELDFLQTDDIKNLIVRSLYIGGGTPTSLDETSLERLLVIIHQRISIKDIDEFTVEAGRPDTLTQRKLELLKAYGVTRLSINPQTMNQRTLDIIGRKHTVSEIAEAFYLARKAGFDNINMDIILGLPGETPEDVIHTIDQISELSPEHITMHTMAIKKGSILNEKKGEYTLITSGQIEKMIHIVNDSVKALGLLPYYLYRQKNILGNFENVGFAKEGKECIYNVEIIEEKESILAFGAGADSKIVSSDCKKVKRVSNVSDANQYINRVDEMIKRKIDGIELLKDENIGQFMR